MSLILGIDLSTKQVDCALLDSESDAAEFHTYDIRDTDAFLAARNVRQSMPSRGWWLDRGVVMAAIEKPYSAGYKTAATLMRVQGAILSCLPIELDVWEMAPTEWKQHSVGSSGASKDLVKHWVWQKWLRGGGEIFPSQDLCDAYAIAYACRELCNKAAESAA